MCLLVIVKKFNDVSELRQLQQLAGVVSDPVFIHSMDDSVMVDVKSFLNLFTLDLSQPVKIVTESVVIGKALGVLYSP